MLIGTNRYSFSNHVLTFLLWFRSLKVIHDNGYQIFTFQIFTLNDKRKCKVVHVHTMQVYRESRGMAPLILSLNTRWSSVVQLRWPLNKNLGGLQRTGRFGEDRALTAAGNRKLVRTVSYADNAIQTACCKEQLQKNWHQRIYFEIPSLLIISH